jgi:hypothetical protein
MSKIRISTTCTSSRVTANTIVLALCTMGPRYGREVAQILARRACLHASGSRQIYQVGGSSPGNNSRFDSSNQFYQVNSVPLWCTIYHHHGQRDKLHFKGIQGLLRRIGNQAQIRVRSTPEDKWASQKKPMA